MGERKKGVRWQVVQQFYVESRGVSSPSGLFNFYYSDIYEGRGGLRLRYDKADL